MNICCSICMDSYIQTDDVRITICGHLFHNNCLNGWLTGAKNSPTCPQCRNVIQVRNLQKVFLNESDDLKQTLKCKCKEYELQIELLKDDLERINQMYKQLEKILFEGDDVEKGVRKTEEIVLNSQSEITNKETGARPKTLPKKKNKSNKIAALRKNFEALGRLPISVTPPVEENHSNASSLNIVDERNTIQVSETECVRNEENILKAKLNVTEQRAKDAEKRLYENNRNEELRIKYKVEEELAKARVLQEVAILQHHQMSSITSEAEAFLKMRLESAEKRIMAAEGKAQAAEQRARAIEQKIQAQLRVATQRVFAAEQRAATAEQVIFAQQRKGAGYHY